MAATLEVSQLCVRYTDITAVSGVSFRVNPGEIVALLGANGAGKTSTLESCIGLRRPTSGHITAFGSDPTSISARVRTGVMLQTGGLYPSARPLAWLEYLARLYPTSATPRDLLEAVGIDPTRRTTNRRLSGGEQQRVKLAAALLPRPDLLYLDEPTAGVDVVARRSLIDLVRAQAQRGAAILLTTHLLTDVDDLADRVVVLDSGRVRAQGT
ncbi:MAG: ABC transporter ATP-binding protein, partial [Candidatus Nanopelagicales bacterium]|nr:ABC transporter ATP-binding protein [Candidatus Nanopelagicales bacterium]